MEQGSHKELLALNGIFASMWADQISASDDPALAIGESGSKEVPGYSVEKRDSAADGVPQQIPPEVIAEIPALEVVAPDSVTESPAPVSTDTETSPVAFPSTDLGSAIQDEAVVIPSEIGASTSAAPQDSPSTSVGNTVKVPTQVPTSSITFGKEVDTPPRTRTPDAEAEPKRKRISSQNFQRLARKISITTRRTGSSSSIPIISGLMRGETPRASSVDGSAGRTKSDSPASSIQGDSDKGKKKKDKRKSVL